MMAVLVRDDRARNMSPNARLMMNDLKFDLWISRNIITINAMFDVTLREPMIQYPVLYLTICIYSFVEDGNEE